MNLTKTLSTGLAIIGSALVLTACSGDDQNPVVPNIDLGGEAQVQVFHASPDAPAVNVLAGGGTLLSNFDYATASPRLTLDAGTLSVEVQGLLPDGTTPTVIGPVDLTLEDDMVYSVFAGDNVADIAPFIVTRERSPIEGGNVRVQVVHAAPNAPMVDVYVTAPGADLSTSAPLGTFEFTGSLGPVDVPAGDYQVRVAVAGTTNVVFDSGTLPLADVGINLTVAAIENTLTGDAPINLLVGNAAGGSIVVQDVNATADVRVVHASPNAPAVDVYANDTILAVENLAYPDFTGFLNLEPATYNFKVTATGADISTAVIDADLPLAQGETYSVLAVNDLAEIEPLVLNSDRRRVATETKVQIVHGSPSAGDVDIYVTAPGADITDLSPAIAEFSFKATTGGFIALPGGTYDITVTPTGTKTAAIDLNDVALDAGGIYTVIARDAARPNSGDSPLPLGVILMDDFVVTN